MSKTVNQIFTNTLGIKKRTEIPAINMNVIDSKLFELCHVYGERGGELIYKNISSEVDVKKIGFEDGTFMSGVLEMDEFSAGIQDYIRDTDVESSLILKVFKHLEQQLGLWINKTSIKSTTLKEVTCNLDPLNIKTTFMCLSKEAFKAGLLDDSVVYNAIDKRYEINNIPTIIIENVNTPALIDFQELHVRYISDISKVVEDADIRRRGKKSWGYNCDCGFASGTIYQMATK